MRHTASLEPQAPEPEPNTVPEKQLKPIRPRKAQPHHRPKVPRGPLWSDDTIAAADVPNEREIEMLHAELLVSLRWTPLDAAGALWMTLAWYATRDRFVRLRAALALRGTWEPVAGVPANRSSCPASRHETGCPHYACRHFLWIGPVSGRPGLERAPRDERGKIVSHRGELVPYREREGLHARWLEPGKLPASCALDVIDGTGKLSNAEIGAAIGRGRHLAANILDDALTHYRDAGGTAEGLQAAADDNDIESRLGNLARLIYGRP